MWQQPCWNMPGIRESSLTRPNFTAHLHPFRGIRRNLQRMSSLGMRAGTPSWDSQVADQLKTMRGSWKNPFWGWHFTRVEDIDEEQGRLLDSRNNEKLMVKVYGHPMCIHKHSMFLGIQKVSQPLHWWAHFFQLRHCKGSWGFPQNHWACHLRIDSMHHGSRSWNFRTGQHGCWMKHLLNRQMF